MDRKKLAGPPLLKRHTGRISSLSFAPDGLTLASAGEEDMSVRVWDMASGKLLRVFLVGEPVIFEAAREVAFSPEGDRLYAHDDQILFAWDWPSGDLIYQKRIEGMMCQHLSPDGRLAAFVDYRSEKSKTRLLDLRQNCILPYSFPQEYEVEGFSPDGSALLLSLPSEDYETRKHLLFTAPDWTLAYETSKDGSHGVTSILGNPVITRLAADDSPGSVCLQFLEMEDGALLYEMPLSKQPTTMGSDSFQFVPGSLLLISCHMHRLPEVFDLEVGEMVATIGPGPSYDTALAISPDGLRIAIGDASGSIRMVSTANWQVEQTLRGFGNCGNLAISADGRWLAVERGQRSPESVWLWDLASLELLGRMEASPARSGDWMFRAEDFTLIYSSDLSWLGVKDSIAHHLLGKALNNADDHAGMLWKSWKYERRQRAITADGSWLALLDADRIVVVDLNTEKVAHEMPFEVPEDGPFGSIVGIAVSPTGRKAAVGLSFAKQSVLVFDFTKKRVAEKRACCDTYDSLAFDPKGRYLAIGDCYQNEVYLRPITNGVKRRGLSGHTDSIRALVFAPNGELVSSGADGLVIVWSGEDFVRRATIVLFEEPFGWAAFTPEGETWGSDGFEEEFV